MPTYQYRCTECGHDLEAVQKFTDATLTECPNCGGSLRKVFNAVGVVFKGSGFYRTDSRNGAVNGAGPGSSEKATPSEKSTSNGDSKPKEPAAPKPNGSNGKQPVGSGASSTGGSSSA
jgi:putative FmdB family regulatory protein